MDRADAGFPLDVLPAITRPRVHRDEGWIATYGTEFPSAGTLFSPADTEFEGIEFQLTEFQVTGSHLKSLNSESANFQLTEFQRPVIST
jgi:hypothetical protein